MPLPLNEAQQLAETLLNALAPGCEQIVIAGSIRRLKALVKDIELVCSLRAGGLFGDEPDSAALQSVIDSLVSQGRIDYDPDNRKDGLKYKRLRVLASGLPIMCIDLFIADADNWGNQLTIRTGDADWSKLIVTARDHQTCLVTRPDQQFGLMPDGLRQWDGYLTRDGRRVLCPTEESFFEALGLPFIEPKHRSAETARRLWEASL